MQGKKIFVADDDRDIVMILKRYLELDGYSVDCSFNGNEAMEKVTGSKFDLLILDVMMQGINGWEICKRVKTDPQTREIPVIILSAKSQDTDALMSFKCGADQYVVKPFDYNELSIIIKRLIQ
ncbi:MAG: response regulator [bacterium]|nr:response regulator [bacterium]